MELPGEVRELFSDAELAEIAAGAPGPDKPDAVALAVAWANQVRKIDSDRSLPWSDRSVWTEHDLAGALFQRDFVEDALNQLRPELARRLRAYVTVADERFRSFTGTDSGERMGRIARVDPTGRGWWWFRVPVDGPIAQDLARY
jgi:hypothetical protein